MGKIKGEEELIQKITAKYNNLSGTFNERARRLWAGNGSRAIGYSGIGISLSGATGWHASNSNNWSLGCGLNLEYGNSKLMPVSGDKTVNNYYSSNTVMEITACWNYGVGGG